MKITRNFGCGDYTFELTFQEMEQAYREHDLNYKIADIESRYKILYNKECPYDETTKKHMAEDFDHALSKNDSYLESYWISLDDIIEKFEKDKKGE